MLVTPLLMIDLLYVESVLEPRRIDAVFFCIVIVGTGEIGHRTGSADDQCAKTIQRPRQVSAAGAGAIGFEGFTITELVKGSSMVRAWPARSTAS